MVCRKLISQPCHYTDRHINLSIYLSIYLTIYLSICSICLPFEYFSEKATTLSPQIRGLHSYHTITIAIAIASTASTTASTTDATNGIQ